MNTVAKNFVRPVSSENMSSGTVEVIMPTVIFFLRFVCAFIPHPHSRRHSRKALDLIRNMCPTSAMSVLFKTPAEAQAAAKDGMMPLLGNRAYP